jgi:hypothetical protein
MQVFWNNYTNFFNKKITTQILFYFIFFYFFYFFIMEIDNFDNVDDLKVQCGQFVDMGWKFVGITLI